MAFLYIIKVNNFEAIRLKRNAKLAQLAEKDQEFLSSQREEGKTEDEARIMLKRKKEDEKRKKDSAKQVYNLMT